MFQRVTCLLLSVTILLGVFGVSALAAEDKKLKHDSDYISSLEDMKALVGTLSYDEYFSEYDDDRYYVTKENFDGISVDVINGDTDNNGDVVDIDEIPVDVAIPSEWENFTEGDKSTSVYLPSTDDAGNAASATWTFNVEEDEVGLYYLYIEYYNCKTSDSSVSAIQRKIKIDGKVPFSEVKSVSFDKNWVYNNITDPVITEAGADDKVGTFVAYDKDREINSVTKERAYVKTVTKVYVDATTGKKMKSVTEYQLIQDIIGNSMTPEAIESSEWNTYVCRDGSGYHDGYFAFYLPYGNHTITLEAEREPMVIKSIKFVPAQKGDSTASSEIPSYSEYVTNHAGKAQPSGTDKIIQIEAEFPDAVSDSSVIPSNSNDSAANFPMSPKAQLFNVIGETSYSAVGQWAAYKFTVNESGMYNLAMRYKQDALQGMFVCRSIKLAGGDYGIVSADGTVTAEVPFKEAQNIRFDYTKEWVSKKLTFYKENGTQEEFKLYLEAGVEYTLYLECSLGDLREYIREVETVLNNVNDCYLRILQRTGSSPDENQDYDFDIEILDTLVRSAIKLEAVADELEALCGTTGSHLATLDTVARILKLMGENYGSEIAANMGNLKTHLGTLGTWVNDSKKGSLLLDTINVVPVDTTAKQLPRAKANFFVTLWHEISSFVYSFFTKYDQMGLTVKPDENTATVDVWLAMGRDQSQIWRTMIDSDGDIGFTKNSGHAVALKLVTAGTLLPSILAGKGPDVYLGLGSADVINYAIRDAIVGVSGNDKNLTAEQNAVFTANIYKNKDGKVATFTDEQIANEDHLKQGYTKLVSNSFNANIVDFSQDKDSRDYYNFSPAAMNTLELLEVTYGIPMTMSFAMMFYRMDVLAELNKEVPESWDELLAILPDLQTNNMTIGVSYISALDFMMYQQGGNMWKYTNDIYGNELKYDPYCEGSKIDLDSDVALAAFEFVCRLYTDYSLPVSYDASNRFRTGEMPIVIGDYIGTYNTLVVFATEIGGLWEFSSLPGSEYYDDNNEYQFNYDSLASVAATVIPNGCDNFQAAWEFIQWQTGREAQANYGNKIVALIGPAAKYETANIKAIEDLSWTAKEKAAIRDQMANLNAIVNYPGSYIYARYMKFAFLDAYNDGARPHEAMMSYIPAINEEIARKREEFKLPVAETEEDALYPSKLVKR